MRLQGPSSDLDPDIDFSEWTWGDFEESTFKPIADRVAEVLWGEVVDSLKDARPHFSLDSEDSERLSIVISLLDTHFLVIPVAEIELDDLEDGGLLIGNATEVDWETSMQRIQEGIAVMQDQIERLQLLIKEIEAEAAEEQA